MHVRQCCGAKDKSHVNHTEATRRPLAKALSRLHAWYHAPRFVQALSSTAKGAVISAGVRDAGATDPGRLLIVAEVWTEGDQPVPIDDDFPPAL